MKLSLSLSCGKYFLRINRLPLGREYPSPPPPPHRKVQVFFNFMGLAFPSGRNSGSVPALVIHASAFVSIWNQNESNSCITHTFQKKNAAVQNGIMKGNLMEVRDNLNKKLSKTRDRNGRIPLIQAVLLERRFVIKHILKEFPKTVNATDFVSIFIL